MKKRKHLMIGAGPAALSALQMIKSIRPDDAVVLMTKEDHLPYSPTALPYLLSGRIARPSVWLKEEGYFKKAGAVLMQGREVVEVDPAKKTVAFSKGKKESYDTLLIATGSNAVGPSVRGGADFLKFHTLADCERLVQQVQGKKEVLIHGGGLVAMETAMALLERGCSVKVVVRSRILRKYFDEEAAGIIEDIFTERGAEIFSGHSMVALSQKDGAVEASLEDGTRVTGQLFVNCTGVKPRVDFLAGIGLSMGQGIVTDTRLMTNLEDIYAAGDAAEAPEFFTGEAGLSAILLSAVNQGKLAGANMCGQERHYRGWIGVNRLPFFGNVAESLGIGAGSEERFSILKDVNKEKGQFKKLAFDGEHLVGATFINCGTNLGPFYQIIERKLDVSKHRDILFDRPFETSIWLVREDERKATHLSV